MVKPKTLAKELYVLCDTRRYRSLDGNALVARNGVGGTNSVALNRNETENPPGPAPLERTRILSDVINYLNSSSQEELELV